MSEVKLREQRINVCERRMFIEMFTECLYHDHEPLSVMSIISLRDVDGRLKSDETKMSSSADS